MYRIRNGKDLKQNQEKWNIKLCYNVKHKRKKCKRMLFLFALDEWSCNEMILALYSHRPNVIFNVGNKNADCEIFSS